MDINVLVAEDDPDINALLCRLLQKHGYGARAAYSGSEARMCLDRYEFHLVLLDLMLPGITGEELIAHIRRTGTMPIIVVSAKTSQEAKVDVLRLGADDFIPKPFDNAEVLARVDAQLRRYMVFSVPSGGRNAIRYKDITLIRDCRKASVNGTELSLTAREFDILALLMSHPDRVFTKANLYETIWSSEFLGDDNTLNVHISNLRSKIAAAGGSAGCIATVWGIGFKMA